MTNATGVISFIQLVKPQKVYFGEWSKSFSASFARNNIYLGNLTPFRASFNSKNHRFVSDVVSGATAETCRMSLSKFGSFFMREVFDSPQKFHQTSARKKEFSEND